MSHLDLSLHAKAFKESIRFMSGRPEANIEITVDAETYDILRAEYMLEDGAPLLINDIMILVKN